MTTRPPKESDSSFSGAPQYEAPVLVPLGNLHDLLAQGGTANCDGTDVVPGAGLDNNAC